jgi:stage II sporulation protein D
VTGLALTAAEPATAASPTTYARPADGVFHISGHGFGHGHGLSQWGAYGGAEAGQDYRSILDWYYANPAFGNANGSLRVQITGDGLGSDRRYDVQVLPATGLTATDSAGHSLLVPAATSAGTTYDRVRGVLAPNGVLVLEGHTAGGWVTIPAPSGGSSSAWTGWIRFTDKARLVSLVRSSGSTVVYRDWVELDQVSGAQGITVNLVTLEHYLYGVVPSEMPCSWTPTVAGSRRLDALEAQAIAARSYATWRRNNPRSSFADMVDSTSDQAYNGYSAETTAAKQCPWPGPGSTASASNTAVDATRTQILVDGSGAALFAQYSASNGGFEPAGSQSYLPSKPDAWDGVPTESGSSHSWTDTVTAGELQSAYSSVGSFTSLTINGREALSGTDQNGRTVSEEWGGRVTSVTVAGSTGETTVSGASFAATMGLKSAWFNVVVSKPGPPASVSAVAGDGQATVRWTPPSSDGGAGIASYTINASPAIPPVTMSASSRSAVITGLTNGTSYTFAVAATNSAGTGSATPSSAVTPQAHAVFHALARTRLVNTTSGGTPLAAHSTRVVAIAGAGGVPATGVVAAVVNVISTRSVAAGSFSVAPHGAARPAEPQVSWPSGVQSANNVWTRVSSGGAIDVVNNSAGRTDLIVVIEGYYTDSSTPGDQMTAGAPSRVYTSRLAAGHSRQARLPGVPVAATAAIVNVTAINPDARVAVTVSGGCRESSTPVLYAAAHANRANTAVIKLCGSNLIISTNATTTVLVDLQGWFAPGSGAASILSPTKQVFRASLAPRQTVTLHLSGAGGSVPTSGVGSLILTLADTSAGSGYLVAYAEGAVRPATSDVDQARGGRPVNTVVVAGGGGVTLYNNSSSTAQTVLDLVGWSA